MLAVLLGVYAIAQMIGRINKTEAAVVSNLKAADKDDHITKEDVKKTLPIMSIHRSSSWYRRSNRIIYCLQ